MKIMITKEWLRNKIEATSEPDIEAGIPLSWLKSLDMFLPREFIDLPVDNKRMIGIKHAFGMLIRGLRKSQKLSIESLAKSASINESELRLIECDPHINAKPRTIYQLANYFNIDKKKLMLLSGNTQSCDEEVEEEALRFAAKSDGVSSLNNEEQKILNEYVKLLNGN